MNNSEQWANEVLRSAEGIKNATPADALFAKIDEQLPKSNKAKVISIKKLSWSAAAACVLILVNIASFSQQLKNTSDQQYANLYEVPIFNSYEPAE